jgi:glycosyltransferase involved in cell wall biosynthesis
MKVALTHDWLNGMRGGEKVLEVFCDLYPEADLYTLFYEPDRVSPKIRALDPVASVLQRFPFARRRYRYYLPLFPWAIGRFDMTIYDVVISSSHCAAKGVRTHDSQVHICYCHAPMRYIWDQFEVYFGGRRRWRLSSILMRRWVERLRQWDVDTAQRVNAFIANSATVAKRIERYYNREATVVHPPIDTKKFQPRGGKPGDYFLVVSALVPYKRIDLAVEAFNKMGRPLHVVGDGPELGRLRRVAGSNIRFLGWVSDEELVGQYDRCRALVFPGEEDFGITAVEAQACGRPVIALRKGGVVETVRERRTGLFFSEPTAEALCKAVRALDDVVFDRGVIRAHAERFGGDRCRHELESTIQAILKDYGL